MTLMSRFEASFCRSAPWRAFAGRVVVPWATHHHRIQGHALEVGGGSGAMAERLMHAHPDLTMTVVDIDPFMTGATARRLARFGSRVEVRQADVTALEFPDASFDQTYCWLMLHHTLRWEDALAELARVTRPGGALIGYDLLDTPVARVLHRLDGSPHRLFSAADLSERLNRLPQTSSTCDVSVGGLVARFSMTKPAT